MENDIITFLVIICGFCGFVGIIVSLSLAHRRQVALLNAEVEIQKKLIEKLSSANEVRAYLDAGGSMAISATMRPRPNDAYYRIIPIVMAGSVVTVVGGALLVRAALHVNDSVRQTVFLLATIVLACGIGLLIAAAVGRALIRKLADSDSAQRK